MNVGFMNVAFLNLGGGGFHRAVTMGAITCNRPRLYWSATHER